MRYEFDRPSVLTFRNIPDLSKRVLPKDSYAFKFVRAFNSFITSFIMSDKVF